MTAMLAFLRGVNLGRRTVRSEDLRDAFRALGFVDARPLLASGNVAFSADADADLAARIEAGLAAHFGFAIGTVLRRREELRDMVAADPFGGRVETADRKLYVTLFAEPVAGRLALPCGIAGDFEVLKVSEREIFHEAWRLPGGRFGPGATLIGKPFGNRFLWTNRNWNTIVRAAAP